MHELAAASHFMVVNIFGITVDGCRISWISLSLHMQHDSDTQRSLALGRSSLSATTNAR